MLMWWSLLSWRRVTVPAVSTLSWRMRKWVSGSPVVAARALIQGAIGLQGRAPAQRPVRPDRVVVMREGVKLALQLRERPHRRLVCQVALERLVQALDLAAGLGVVGPRVLGGDPQPLELDLQEHLAAPRGRGEDSAVVAEQGGRA